MKNTALIISLLLFSCKGKTQESINKFDTTTEIIANDKLKNSKTEAYHTYLTVEKDTVLLNISKYIRKDIEKDTIIKNSEEIQITSFKDKKGLLFFHKAGNLYMIKKDQSRYNLISKIESIRETSKDGIGQDFDTIYSPDEVKHFKDNLYLVIFKSEGNFKVGIFEITEKGFTKKFISKGCLFFDEWSDFTFYNIKKNKIFVNYQIKRDSNEIGTIELKYENGNFSLNKDQCGEWMSK